MLKDLLKNDSHVITRFAPSPTGYMTLGNFRTALFSWLFAMKHHGIFLLRIEDTDQSRSETIYTEQLINDLHIMGLSFDPALVCHQSQRHEIYAQYAKKLENQGDAYFCYCTQEELSLERKIQLGSGVPPRYSGRCRSLSKEDRLLKESQGLKPVLRFRVSDDKISFSDLMMGHKEFFAHTIGDFIITKTDGQATFFFSNAVDDALTGVTHALRGDDHLTNTPRQLLILKKLDLNAPHYGHFPLILGYDHKPLSKRTGSRSIKELLEEGYLPQAIINYLARLGHHVESDELLTLNELVDFFDCQFISKGAAHFDQGQLDFWQKKAFMKLNYDDQYALLNPYLHEIQDVDSFWALVKGNISRSNEIAPWIERLQSPGLLIDKEIFSEYHWNIDHFLLLKANWSSSWAQIVDCLKNKGLKGKSLFMPLRMLLTGVHDGPPLESLYNYIETLVINQRLETLIYEFGSL